MTVTFDVSSGSAALINSATTTSWSHAASASAKGAVVVIPQGTATDQVSGVTYGSRKMDRIRFAARTSAEACAVYVYFLGNLVGITGTQTVAVTSTGTAPKWPQAATMLAAGTFVAVNKETGADAGVIANPSITLIPDVAGTMWFYVNASGLNTPVNTPQAGTTSMSARDLGTISGHTGQKAVAAAGSNTTGWTSAIDDVVQAALAISEYNPPSLVMGRYL
jgi:hypothetical protein